MSARPRALRVGVEGAAGAGKTALIEQLLPRLIARGTEVGVIAHDPNDAGDAGRLRRSGLIAATRIQAADSAMPSASGVDEARSTHAAAQALESRIPGLRLILVERPSGATHAPAASARLDYRLLVVDALSGEAAGLTDDPAMRDSNLVVINKCDLAARGRVDVGRALREAEQARGARPVVATSCATGVGIEMVVDAISRELLAGRHSRASNA